MKLKIAYFYPKELNLYGDTGNIEILIFRAKARGFDVEVSDIYPETKLSKDLMQGINLVFMGGGPDSGQKEIYTDLKSNKGPYLKEHMIEGGSSLFICGAYQLMGHYYEAADGKVLDGLGAFDIHTKHFGSKKERCVGNIICTLSEDLFSNNTADSFPEISKTLVGFENHGGRTYLGKDIKPFSYVEIGCGNNGEDRTEGAIYKNSIGTYMHGPFLSKNPHIADLLISRALRRYDLEPLDDKIVIQAHTALLKRFK